MTLGNWNCSHNKKTDQAILMRLLGGHCILGPGPSEDSLQTSHLADGAGKMWRENGHHLWK